MTNKYALLFKSLESMQFFFLFEGSALCSPRLHLSDKKMIKQQYCEILLQFYILLFFLNVHKLDFSAAINPIFPSEIIC